MPSQAGGATASVRGRVGVGGRGDRRGRGDGGGRGDGVTTGGAVSDGAGARAAGECRGADAVSGASLGGVHAARTQLASTAASAARGNRVRSDVIDRWCHRKPRRVCYGVKRLAGEYPLASAPRNDLTRKLYVRPATARTGCELLPNVALGAVVALCHSRHAPSPTRYSTRNRDPVLVAEVAQRTVKGAPVGAEEIRGLTRTRPVMAPWISHTYGNVPAEKVRR